MSPSTLSKALLPYPPPTPSVITALSQLKSSYNLCLLSFKVTAKNGDVQMLLGAFHPLLQRGDSQWATQWALTDHSLAQDLLSGRSD